MIYCFDIDGVLCDGEIHHAKPFKERIEKVNKLYNEGHTIIIETARGSETGIDWKPLTKRQLRNWGVKYHQLRTGVKIFADWYVDDHGIKDSDFFK